MPDSLGGGAPGWSGTGRLESTEGGRVHSKKNLHWNPISVLPLPEINSNE
jgi:hypothetical protein